MSNGNRNANAFTQVILMCTLHRMQEFWPLMGKWIYNEKNYTYAYAE